MTHDELLEITCKWFKEPDHGNTKHPYLVKELKSWNHSIPDIFSFGSGCSTVIKVKVSRSDFLRDFKKPKVFIGNEKYYCSIPGIIKPEELPEGWGLLEYDDLYINSGLTLKAIQVKVKANR